MKDTKKQETGWIAQDVVREHAKIKAKHEAAVAAAEAGAKAKSTPVGFIADDVKKRHEVGFIAQDVVKAHKQKMHEDFIYYEPYTKWNPRDEHDALEPTSVRSIGIGVRKNKRNEIWAGRWGGVSLSMTC